MRLVPIQDLQQHLLTCKRKTITLDALQEASRDSEYTRFFPDIRSLEEQGVLVPIRAAGKDHAGLARKYSIHRGALLAQSAAQIEREAVAAHILGELHLDWYTAQPLEVWTQDLPAIRKLSAYLSAHPEPPSPASLQQRSYDMFRNEKFLLEHADFLSHLDISRERLAIAAEADPLMLAFPSMSGRDCILSSKTRLPGLPCCPTWPKRDSRPLFSATVGKSARDCTSCRSNAGHRMPAMSCGILGISTGRASASLPI